MWEQVYEGKTTKICADLYFEVKFVYDNPGGAYEARLNDNTDGRPVTGQLRRVHGCQRRYVLARPSPPTTRPHYTHELTITPTFRDLIET